jgi:hypothetical protein
VGSTVYDLLDAEWRTLARRPVPSAWRSRPPLAGAGRLGPVVESCRDRTDPATANRTLGAVLALAAGGDPLAARVALQAVLPLVVSTAAGLAGYVGWGPWTSRADLDGEAAATMVELIGAPLPPGTHWPAAALGSRLRDRLRTTVRRHRRQHQREPVLAADAAHPPSDLHEAYSAAERLARFVVDATRGGDISLTAAQTVLATTVYGWDTASVARLTGRDVRAVRAHRRRTEQRLATLVVA